MRSWRETAYPNSSRITPPFTISNTDATGGLARWRGGKQSICPLTIGLTPQQTAFVTARLRALAEYVGAPLHSNPRCHDNVRILFTNNPEKEMDGVVKWAMVYFRNRYLGGGKYLIAFRSDHEIQGWYMTTNGGRGLSIGAIADYLAMLSLTVAQSPDHCDPLPSILDLMSSKCGKRESPTTVTAGDLAFLKALYYKNAGSGRSLTRSQVQDNMRRQFKQERIS